MHFKGKLEHLILWLSIILCTIVVINQDWLWRWNFVIYDTQLRLWERPTPDNIIIIAIDEYSLQHLGRWPWSRDKYSTLLDILTEEKASAIGLDIIFSEPSPLDSENDSKLADALNRNGRTVLPIIAERTSLHGQLLETLPIPEIANASKAMGHVHVELDQDGIARSVFLKGGLGSPHWNHFSYELVKIASPNEIIKDMGIKNTQPLSSSPMVWVRDNRMLIPYSGPPGHFQTLSFFQVLNRQYPKNIFNGKIVLIGATASGLGDALPTPVSGKTHSMPGVEINAHIANNLTDGINISIISTNAQMLLSTLILILTMFLYSIFTPKWSLISVIIVITSTLVFSLSLMVLANLWFPPAPVMLALALSYPLWSWRRLENTIRYLDEEIAQLSDEYKDVPNNSDIAPEASLMFLTNLLPISGWVIYNHNGGVVSAHGDHPKWADYFQHNPDSWKQSGNNFWLTPEQSKDSYIYAIKWAETTPPTKEQKALFDDFLLKEKSTFNMNNKLLTNTVDDRIIKVQEATNRMRGLRQFISDSLSQMANGVLIVDPLGNIAIANHHAAYYLGKENDTDLHGKSLLSVLENFKANLQTDWPSIFQDILLRHMSVNIEAQNTAGKDFIIQLSPLDRQHRELGGLIVSMSDISELKASERRRDEVLGFLSHDLRTPLVSLIALLEIARTKKPSLEFSNMLDRINTYAENTITLADEFLLLAQAESGENINFKDSDLTTISLNAIEQIWFQAEKKHIELKYRSDIEDVWLIIDPSLIERAILNLLSNAIKYSPENTTVTLTITSSDEHYICAVQDQGNGIPEDDLEHLFERYYRVNSTKHPKQKVKGTGLGLAFVKTVMDKHHGDVLVTSTKGEGSQFSLLFNKSASEKNHN